MEIKTGTLYQNRTWKYLYSSLKAYGPKLTSDLITFFRLAIGIGDVNHKTDESCLYILIDMNTYLLSDRNLDIYKDRFSAFLDWLKYQSYYEADYPYERDKSHMVVIKVPEKHIIAHEAFKRGLYSHMYSSTEISTYFPYSVIGDMDSQKAKNDIIENCRQVLTKDVKYIPTFVALVNSRYKTTATIEDFLDAELDFPYNKQEEIFNYVKEEKEE